MKKLFLSLSVAGAIILTGCATGSGGVNYSSGVAGSPSKGQSLSLGIDAVDIENTAEKMLDKLYSAPFIKSLNPKNRYSIKIDGVKNDTTIRLDTRELTSYIEEAVLNRGFFVVTGAEGQDAIDLASEREDLRDNAEFDQRTIAKSGTIKGRDYILQGRILSRNTKLDNGKTHVDYTYIMTLVDATNGMRVWSGRERISKDNRK